MAIYRHVHVEFWKDPKVLEELTETEIKEAMNTIIEKDIFSPNGGSLVSSVSAKVVQTDTTDYDLVL